MRMNINDLTIEEKIGQMMMVGIEGKHITQRTKKLILKHKIGGIILYKKNFNSYSEMLELIKQLKELNKKNKIPLFIAIDQEGGRVNRMPNEILKLPAANLIADKLGEEGIREAAEITAEILIKSGYNMNLAPVLDIKKYNNNVIGDRSFSENIEIVSKYGVIQLKEYQKRNIYPVIKHFPGHGMTNKDSHFRLPNVTKDINEIENEDMKPFEEAIENGADGVLIGHLRIKGVTGTNPSSLSRKFIIKKLRRKYNYRGLTISDDLKMKAIKYRYGAINAVIKSFEAGNDITIFRYNEKQETKVFKKIIDLVEQNKIKNCQINKSVKRIIEIKNKYQIQDDKEIGVLDIDNINKRILKIREQVL